MVLPEAVSARLPSPGSSLRRLVDPLDERPTLAESLRTTGRVCGLLLGLAGVAWTTGRAYRFPSPGPSAYALAVSPSAATSRPQRVFRGHLFGVVGGLVAYHLLAPGLTVTNVPPPLSVAGADRRQGLWSGRAMPGPCPVSTTSTWSQTSRRRNG